MTALDSALKLTRVMLVALLFLPALSSADEMSLAEARGWLNLAYDSLDGGLYGEALSYLEEIEPGGPLEEEVVHLLLDTLVELGRYGEAVKLLEGDGGGSRGAALPEKRFMTEELYRLWGGELVASGAFEEARALVKRGAERLGGSGFLSALSRAYVFREELGGKVSEALSPEAAIPFEAPLRAGSRIALKVDDGKAPGKGQWLEACAGSECALWLPTEVADDISKKNLAVWLEPKRAELLAALEYEAKKSGLEARVSAGAVILRHAESEGGQQSVQQLEELRAATAREGLGLRATALLAVSGAVKELGDFAELEGWLKENRRELALSPYGTGVKLINPATQRTFSLSFSGWSDLFFHSPDEWERFWGELRAELGRQARPYRCFCGREVIVRESYLPEKFSYFPAGGDEHGPHRWGVTAYCLKHKMPVNEAKRLEWGVTPEELSQKCREQAGDEPWEIYFSEVEVEGEGEGEGERALLLSGAGATALVKNTDVLLGLLEKIKGKPMSGETVTLWAPTDEVLVVDSRGAEGLASSPRAGSLLDNLGLPYRPRGTYSGFEAIITLPAQRRGTVKLMSLE